MKTRRDDIVEVLHGVAVADPYRWLEDGDSPEVRAFDDAQNDATRAWLARCADRDSLRRRAREILAVGHVGAPAIRTTRAGERRFFHVKREGGQEQAVLLVRDGADGPDRVLVDPAPLSVDRTTAIDWWSASHDGARLAWGLSEAGSEESTLRIRNVDTGDDLADRIPHTRHASVAWMPDGESLFYTRHPAPGTVPPGDEQYYSRVFRHRVGDDWTRDSLVFGQQIDKLDVPSVHASPDGRWLVVRVHKGWQRSDLWARDLSHEAAPWIAVATGIEALFDPVPLDDALYVMTNDGSPRGRLFEVPWSDVGDRARWREILAERQDVLADVAIGRREVLASYLREAAARVERFGRDGKSLGAVALPTVGSAGVHAAHDGDEAFVEFTSFATPWQVLRVDGGGATRVWDRVGASFEIDDVRVTTMHATSKDGTRVPMFIVEKAGTPRDANRPAVLYGYGGFNISQTPAFGARALLTVERGGVWVVALLRGGGEMGEEWHRAGMLEHKQNVFDDLFACAETLFRERVTRPDRLGVVGGSNGGLLVAAAVTQRPEMFRAGLCLVPLADMLRYHRFRIGALWVAEYGDPSDARAFSWLHAYSPYHRVKDGARYPSMMFATAESDSRVDPMHARKMAARVQHAQGDPDRPILLRVEKRAGHGAGKPVAKLVDELADEMAFLFHELEK